MSLTRIKISLTSSSVYTRQPRESFLGGGIKPFFSHRFIVRIVRSNRRAKSFILNILVAIEIDQRSNFLLYDMDDIGLLSFEI